ncbi:hypothetical protein [Geothrix sp. 21YS21S-4]|uniref:hypothetical protein n=1 Tax=Geothrix sp. 21YS21S-4 TaxID=3068889 RepID=UPI0027BA8759|nr:hypothetical protein [Geothrix sp. 21YS21S-4]
MSHSQILRWGWGIQMVSPLIPVLAATMHWQSGRYVSFSWMRRLTAFVVFQLVVNWTMLGMAINLKPNYWVADLVHLPEAFLPLWVLAGLALRFPMKVPLTLGGAAIVLSTAWDASHVGLKAKWPLAAIVSCFALLMLCVGSFIALLLKEETPRDNHPAYWLLGTWALDYGIMLMFYPMQTFFLQHLSREWILVPWMLRFTIGLLLNITLAKTFLCRKTS